MSIKLGFPRGLSGKEESCKCRRCGFNPWVGKIPGEGNNNPLQYSFFFLKIYLFISGCCWVFVGVRGLSLVAESRAYPLVAMCGLLIAVAS